MPFKDRSDAGRKLAKVLGTYKDQKPVVLALPRGGVLVAAEVASALSASLDLILVRKLGTALQPELAIGAVVDGGRPIIVRNEDVIRLVGVSEAEFQAICVNELAEIDRRRQHYLGDRARVEISGRLAIVIDDGVATGATARAALRATRMRGPSRLAFAVPVASTDALAALRGDAQDIVCLEDYRRFGAVGQFYQDFAQVTDQQVIATLARFPPSALTVKTKPAA
jgi:putative phosphoribosyl transferase